MGSGLESERSMTEKQPTYEELLARVARLERQLELPSQRHGGESPRAEAALDEAQEALRKSEQNFRQITEESPVAIYIIQGGKLVYVNPSLARQAGYSREEIVGKLAPQDLIHRQDVARLMTTLGERAAGRIQGEGVEYRGIRKDGSIVHIAAYGMQMEYQGKPAVMGTLIDISERKRLEDALSDCESRLSVALSSANADTWEWKERLRLSEEKYRSLFNNAEVGMFRIRLDGSEILDFNEKYLEIYGLAREEMLGRPAASYWADPAQRGVLVEELEANGRVTNFECRMLTKNGDVKTCLTSVRLYPERGIIEGSLIDITERKRAEEEHRKLEHQLSQAQRVHVAASRNPTHE